MRIYSYYVGIVLFLGVSLQAYAQENSLRGKVTDKRGEPVLAANVYLKNEPAKGTISDINGNFVLQYRNLVNDTLVVSFLGLKTKTIPTNTIDTAQEITIVMEDDQQMLVELVVKYNPSLSREFSVKEISKFDIYNTPSSAGDALKMVTALASSTNVSESANTELRGSSGDMSRVILNGVPIYKPVRNSQINGIGNFSLFNSEMIEEQNVYGSNPPLIYSNATAGLIEIGTIRKLSSRETALSLSLANIGILHSQPVNEKSFFQIYGNCQFSKPFLWVNAKNEDVNTFSSEDAGLNFHTEVADKLTINLYSYFINEKYGANDYSYAFSGELTASKRRNFNIVNLKYKLNRGFLSVNNGTDFSKENFEFGNILSSQRSCFIYNNLDFKYYFTSSWNLQAGISHEYSKLSYKSQFPKYYYALKPADPHFQFDNGIFNHNLELYLYNRLKPFDNLTVGVGVRKNIPVKDQAGYLSYQMNLKYALNANNSLLLSGGKYNGYNTPYLNTQEFTPISARQLSLEYAFTENDFQIQLATYHKRENANDFFSETDTSERLLRKIWGAEVNASQKLGDLTATFSYTYLNSRFKKENIWYNSSNRMDYLIKAYVSYFHRKAGTFSLSVLSRPGLYYSPIIGSVLNEAGLHKPLYGNYNTDKHSEYYSLDFSYNKVIALKSSNLILFLTINNIIDRKNENTIIYNNNYTHRLGYKYYNRRSFYLGIQLRFQ